MNPATLKPARFGWVFKPILVITSLGLPAVSAFLLLLPRWSPLPVFVILSLDGLAYVWFKEMYRQTGYELTERNIRVRTGTFFHEQEQKLLWNIVYRSV